MLYMRQVYACTLNRLVHSWVYETCIYMHSEQTCIQLGICMHSEQTCIQLGICMHSEQTCIQLGI